MPRTPSIEQFERYQRLHEIYLAWPRTLLRLPPADQIALSLFYEPEREHTLASLRTNQQEMKQIDPSLPQRAGKAYVKAMQLLPLVQERASRPRKKGAPYELFVFSELNENLDPKAMAKVLIRIMEERKHGPRRDDVDKAA